MTVGALETAIRDAVAEAIGPLLGELRALKQQLANLQQGGGPAEEEAFLSISAAAALVGVGPAAIRNWIRVGRLPRHGRGHFVRVRRADLVAMMTGGEEVAMPCDMKELAQAMRQRGKRLDVLHSDIHTALHAQAKNGDAGRSGT